MIMISSTPLSHQRQNPWRFSPLSLNYLRKKHHEDSCTTLAENFEYEKSLSKSSQETILKDFSGEFLTLEEEILYSFYLQLRIQNQCQQLQYPSFVTATALSFFKRFLLVYSIMDFDMKVVIPAIVFLAGKVENIHAMVEDICKYNPNVSSQLICQMEITIARSLKFQFYLVHPYDALYGFFLDLQKHVDNIDLLYEAFKEATDRIHLSCLTDLEFFYSPSQIAFAFFYHVYPVKNRPSLERYIKEIWSEEDSILKQIHEINKVMDEGILKIEKDEITRIDRKLRFCRNPAYDPKSALYKYIQLHKEQRIEEDFLKKQEMIRKETKENDPF